tara:strand:+ start:5323 stop:6258 length:936 start_codon:yes stop_codon:yes gene_type:complete
MNSTHFSGYVAILGRPNAGKSTLMNALVGSKLSIATHKAQTTRHQIMGIYSEEDCQIIFLDTPGIIQPKYELQKAMMRFVKKAEKEADVMLLLVDLKRSYIKQERDKKNLPIALTDLVDHELLGHIRSQHKPIILVLNKMDTVPREWLKKVQEAYEEAFTFTGIQVISALEKHGISALINQLKANLPKGPAFYPKDELSEHPLRFFVSEFIREQLFLNYHEELPYSATIEILEYQESPDIDRIMADIVVNRNSQKGIIIGKKGVAIKQLGIQSRTSIESFLDKQVHLELHVKVREKWREKKHMVRNLGYRE